MPAERALFTPFESKNIYNVIFEPAHFSNAVILCAGFASEFEVFRSHLTRFGRLLAENSILTLRFDYRGYGDSEGGFESASVSSMTADILSRIAWLKESYAPKSITLIGVRFGAALAALAAQECSDIARLALWNPLIRPWDDFWTDLRQTVSMQTVLFRDVKKSRDDILTNVLNNQPTMVDGYNLNVIDDGYPLHKDFVEQVKQINLSQINLKQRNILLLQVQKKNLPISKPLQLLYDQWIHCGNTCELSTVQEKTIPWKHEDVYTVNSPTLFSHTLQWLTKSFV